MTRRLLVLLGVLAGFAPGAEAATPPVSAEALLAAGIPWPTVRQVAGADWWPQVPQFETPPLFRQPLPKRPLAVTSQWYVRPGADSGIQTTLVAFAGTTEPGVCPLLAEADGVPINARVPAVGKSHVFWVPGDSAAPVTILCFERGPVMVEVKVLGETWSAAKLGRLGAPVDANVKALLAGKLPHGVGSATLGLLPARADAPGKELGTALVPAEAWASNATDPTPQQLAGQLNRGGSTSLPYRRYLLSDGTNVVDLTLFRFRSAVAAKSWFARLDRASSAASIPLTADGTGAQSLFRQVEEQYYVLDFVAGNAVADIACYAPYGEKPSTTCAAALRKLGPRWYAQLARA